MTARDKFLALLDGNRSGKQTGIYSICSAHEAAIRAGMSQASADNSIVLIESTSNQVDQYGGYTGMKPQEFIDFVFSIADEEGFDHDSILLGGDHLGPNAWQEEAADSAMEKAHVLVAEYVKAGYQKIHLDTSMFLADDKGDRSKPLDDEVAAKRGAALCASAEKSWAEQRPDFPKPVYIIGTEVPIPGGAQEEEESLKPSSPADVRRTIESFREAFKEQGLEEAWERVYGLVVQPGVEFGDETVFDYRPEAASELSRLIEDYPRLVFEAHSTDYQTEEALAGLVADHFAILKVGPALTFAYREGLFALCRIEEELFKYQTDSLSRLKETLEEVMTSNPKYWKKYYHGSEAELYLKRGYSYSDRARYYWPNQKLNEAKEKLYANISERGIPLSLLSQYLPHQYWKVREGRLNAGPADLVRGKIEDVLDMYSRACKMRSI